jgi:UDP-2-acetamido-2,6-beta-L-arabino-hexul-4-ose reductase
VRVVITGADGFIGKHLVLRLHERGEHQVSAITRDTSDHARQVAWADADVVVHLAGVNRPPDPSGFELGNAAFTKTLVDELTLMGRPVPVVFSSSSQAALDNPYGRSKAAAEEALAQYGATTGAAVAVLRLTNVFGKWARPNYNSAVATFCHNIARGQPISIHDPSAPLRLLYVDDVIDAIEALLPQRDGGVREVPVGPVYETTVGAVADTLKKFAEGRQTREFGAVGSGLTRALYATYVSFLPPQSFSYALQLHMDSRGSFAEMLRTPSAGQFSFFTAHPGVTRGGHYHHSKTEKFLVVHGKARFGFRQVLTGERHEILVDGVETRVVETVPGWAHDITNVGEDQLIVLLWANEAFDPARPDTIAAEV